jgi:hypothetical protein
MDLQQQLIDAIRQELQRQATGSQGHLRAEFSSPSEQTAVVQGPIDLAALAMVVTGTVAGGP